MAEATGSVPASLRRCIPDEIAIWEIIVRLPPKDVLRCRAVCPDWRRATSTRDFLLAHHARQPTLPLLYGFEYEGGKYCQNILTFDHQAAAAVQPTLRIVNHHNSAGDDGRSVDIIPLDHLAGLAPANQLQPVTRLGARAAYMNPQASCDGLLILNEPLREISICNPATHQYAPLTQLHDRFKLLGFYPHIPTGEYRLLLGNRRNLAPGGDGTYVFALGSGQPPRHIGYPEAREVICTSPLLFGGNLHWHVEKNLSGSGSNLIMVFDTTTELFSQMHAPAVRGYADLLEMGDMLGMASSNSAKTIIDIWVMQDYESQVWAFKCRIQLPFEELQRVNYHNVVFMPEDGELLLLVETEDGLHHVDINGKLVASFHRTGLSPTLLRLKQTLVQHTFFPILEGYVVNDSPFI